ncbi:MAG: type II toxin-antitoxin system YhaV family toxin, partial [Cyanobium sp.]
MINGWRVFAHPLFLDQLEALIADVEALRRKDPQGYGSKVASKHLAAITRLMLHDIPQDPSRKEFQQGTTLGADHRHWRRAKFF